MNRESNLPALELRGISKQFVQGGAELNVLESVDFEIRKGEVIALVGPSGSGKSTLLHIAGLLERPTAGEVFVDGDDCNGLSDGARTKIRRNKLGFVYQFHHLLPEFSALENIALPQLIAGRSKAAADEAALSLLSRFGLQDRATHRPAQLSGGEQQRVAIGRAVANQPNVLLADEPTGNLDPKTADRVYEELLTLVRGDGLAAVIATHNMELAQAMDRTFVLENGKLSAVS